MTAHDAIAASAAHTARRAPPRGGHPTPGSKVLPGPGGAAGGKWPRDLASASVKNRISFRFGPRLWRRNKEKVPEKSIIND